MNDRAWPALRCLNCDAALHAISATRFECLGCGRFYLATMGIVDLRGLHPEEKENPALSEQLVAAYPTCSWTELVELYFAMLDLDGLPQELVDHYRYYRDEQMIRGKRFTEMFLGRLGNYYGEPTRDTVLELGCGSGASLLALSGKFDQVIGLDPHLPSLIMASKLLEENGVANVRLIQGYGQSLPFFDSCFNCVTAQNVLEHVFEVEKVVSEIWRVLQNNGCLAADSRNRYDLLFPEPHVNVRWVGFLPRAWAKRYVKWRKDTTYENTYLLSYWELESALNKTFGDNFRVVFPGPTAYGQSPWMEKLVFGLERGGPLSKPLLWLFPSHLVLALKQDT